MEAIFRCRMRSTHRMGVDLSVLDILSLIDLLALQYITRRIEGHGSEFATWVVEESQVKPARYDKWTRILKWERNEVVDETTILHTHPNGHKSVMLRFGVIGRR